MAKNDADWSPKKLQALMGLVTHNSVSGAAEASGVPVRSLYRWLKDDDFRRDLHVIREYVNMYSLNYLRTSKVFAVEKIKEMMADPLVDTKDRLGLCKWYLEFLQKDPVITPVKTLLYERPNDPAEDWLTVKPEEDSRWETVEGEADQYEDEQEHDLSDITDEELTKQLSDLRDYKSKVDKIVDKNKDEEAL